MELRVHEGSQARPFLRTNIYVTRPEYTAITLHASLVKGHSLSSILITEDLDPEPPI